jgi:hypothetical protein
MRILVTRDEMFRGYDELEQRLKPQDLQRKTMEKRSAA